MNYRKLLPQRRWVVALACAAMGAALPATYGLFTGVREPVVHDEFSYLLGADTFANGRLTNSSPRFPDFFETEHVLVVPTYQSKYPPGQALILAAGQRLFGHPIWGVWLGCALFAAALCWMLQAWTSDRWAFAITAVMSATLGTSTYWAQSYWGGMIPACGAALVFGGTGRTLRRPAVLTSCMTAVGVLILANTRPYEGAFVCVAAFTMLMRWLPRPIAWSWRDKFRLSVLPAALVLCAGFGAMALYNHAVTGSYWRTPYGLHLAQYFHQGVFIFSAHREAERAPPERIARFYESNLRPVLRGRELAGQIAENFAIRLPVSLTPVLGLFASTESVPTAYSGLALWIVLLLIASAPQISISRLLPVAIVAVVAECLAWRYAPYYPWAFALPIVLLAGRRLGRSLWRDSWLQLPLFAILLVAVGQSLVLWWHPHYAAPIAPAVYILLASCLHAKAPGSEASLNERGLSRAVLILLVLHAGAVALMGSMEPSKSFDADARSVHARADVIHRLEAQGGQHLVFVKYKDGYSMHREWVFNRAEIADSPVILAHDLGSRNSMLMREYPSRLAWAVTVAPGIVRFTRYPLSTD